MWDGRQAGQCVQTRHVQACACVANLHPQSFMCKVCVCNIKAVRNVCVKGMQHVVVKEKRVRSVKEKNTDECPCVFFPKSMHRKKCL